MPRALNTGSRGDRKPPSSRVTNPKLKTVSISIATCLMIPMVLSRSSFLIFASMMQERTRSSRMSSRRSPLLLSFSRAVSGVFSSNSTSALINAWSTFSTSRKPALTPGLPTSIITPTCPRLNRPERSLVLHSSVPLPYPVEKQSSFGQGCWLSLKYLRTIRGQMSSSCCSAPVGHAAILRQLPHSTHLSRSITAFSSSCLIASTVQVKTHSPHPIQVSRSIIIVTLRS